MARVDRAGVVNAAVVVVRIDLHILQARISKSVSQIFIV